MNEINPLVKHSESTAMRLARIAYEAYCETTGWKSAITGADLPLFRETPPKVQVGWRAAAMAVVNQTCIRPIREDNEGDTNAPTR